MLGSLMMFAPGVFASSPSSASASSRRCASVRRSGNRAMMRPASEMSRVSTSTPAVRANASTIGLSEYVASSGASSVRVYMIFAMEQHLRLRWGLFRASLSG